MNNSKKVTGIKQEAYTEWCMEKWEVQTCITSQKGNRGKMREHTSEFESDHGYTKTTLRIFLCYNKRGIQRWGFQRSLSKAKIKPVKDGVRWDDLRELTNEISRTMQLENNK